MAIDILDAIDYSITLQYLLLICLTLHILVLNFTCLPISYLFHFEHLLIHFPSLFIHLN